MEGRIPIKVYYEDTDCLGVVYHASYLRFFERGRSEFVAQLGRPIEDWNTAGVVLAVYKMQITFRRAARLGDACEVVTCFAPRKSEYRLQMQQTLMRAGELVCEAQVQLVCLDESMAVRSFPDEFLQHADAAS